MINQRRKNMKNDKLTQLVKQKNIVVPLYLLKLYPKLNIKLDEFIFLMYLKESGDLFLFNPKQMAEEYEINVSQVMSYISKLTDKNLLRVEVLKNEHNIREEYINLEDFYKKISLLLTDIINQKDESMNDNIFEMIEKEFGRTLSPMEYEIIKAWIDNNISEELIQEALREAVYNGVSNLRYIDKILYEWGKKGIKNKDDVEKHKKRYQQEKKDKKEAESEVFEYDWFEEHDDK